MRGMGGYGGCLWIGNGWRERGGDGRRDEGERGKGANGKKEGNGTGD